MAGDAARPEPEILESAPVPTRSGHRDALVVAAVLAAALVAFGLRPGIDQAGPVAPASDVQAARSASPVPIRTTFRTGIGRCEVTVHGRYPLHRDCFASEAALRRWLGVAPDARIPRTWRSDPQATCGRAE